MLPPAPCYLKPLQQGPKYVFLQGRASRERCTAAEMSLNEASRKGKQPTFIRTYYMPETELGPLKTRTELIAH